jgi:sugar phosphate permease
MSFLSFGDSYWAHMFLPFALFGLGIGTSFVPMTLTATAGVPLKEAGLASGLINTTRQVGGALGLAVLATLAANVTRDDRSSARSVAAALTSGYDRAFLIAGLLLILGAGLALFIPSASAKAIVEARQGTSAPSAEAPEPELSRDEAPRESSYEAL